MNNGDGITIDDRSGSAELLPFMPDAEIGRLEFGDFAFLGKGVEGPVPIGVERKQINDMIRSMLSGNLAGRQLPGMANLYQVSYIVVEGIYRRDSSGNIEVYRGHQWARTSLSMAALWGFITSIEQNWGAKVRCTSTKKETAEMICSLNYWWNKEQHTVTGNQSLTGFSFSKATLLNTVALQLPGLGGKRAKAAASHFTSISEMVNATVPEWMEIEGIGKQTAQLIVRSLKGGK